MRPALWVQLATRGKASDVQAQKGRVAYYQQLLNEFAGMFDIDQVYSGEDEASNRARMSALRKMGAGVKAGAVEGGAGADGTGGVVGLDALRAEQFKEMSVAALDIAKDVDRTLPEHPRFRRKANSRLSLFRVLLAFSRHNKKIA